MLLGKEIIIFSFQSSFKKHALTRTEGNTLEHLRRIKQKPLKSVPNELKAICMEVVQLLKRESDLESLSAALAYTDRNECESKPILRCHLHRRIAAPTIVTETYLMPENI